MGLKQKIKNRPGIYKHILSILNGVNYFDWQFHRRYPRYVLTPYWKERIRVVKSSPDNQKLDHVAEAGQIFSDHQLMGNGLKITLGSYYDYGNTHLLLENHGVHEPQEELAFAKLLPFVPAKSTMMELGSYWAFYSMWFAREVKEGNCFMVEPDPHKMNFGQLNFKRNGLSGTFDLGFISDKTDLRSAIPYYSVDHLMKKHRLSRLTILHSDIQGYELKMLEGASEALQAKAIDYLFISTHSNELHQQCLTYLQNYKYEIACEANLDASYSVDGLIVARLPEAPGPHHIDISKRN